MIFDKLKNRWKQEWYNRNSAQIAREFDGRRIELVKRLEDEIEETRLRWESKKDSLLNKIRLEQEEIAFKTESINCKKIQLNSMEEDYRLQIKLMEAKASPSNFWAEAFSQGVSKTWDLLQSVQVSNMEKLKKQLFDDAYEEAIRSLNDNKKTK